MVVTRTAVAAGVAVLVGAVSAGTSPVIAAGMAETASTTPAQRLDSPFAVGDLFPDLAFPSLDDGDPTRLSDFRGRKVMLHVFASW